MEEERKRAKNRHKEVGYKDNKTEGRKGKERKCVRSQRKERMTAGGRKDK